MAELGLLAFTLLALLPIAGIDSRASALPWYYGGGDDGNVTYIPIGSSIQQYINKASDGDTLALYPGVYPVLGGVYGGEYGYGLTIYGKSLIIRGATHPNGEPASEIILENGTYFEVTAFNSEENVFQNLSVKSFGSYGSGLGGFTGAFFLNGGNPIISNCKIVRFLQNTTYGYFAPAAVAYSNFEYGGKLTSGELKMLDTEIKTTGVVGIELTGLPGTGGAFLDACIVRGPNNGSIYGAPFGIAADDGIPLTLLNTTVCGFGYGETPQIWAKDILDLGGNCEEVICEDCNLSSCPADLNYDAIANGADLTILIADWGCTGPSCAGDINNDLRVDGADLTVLLSSWGVCSE
jgi:hypothetical protein